MSSAERPECFSVDDHLSMEELALTKSESNDGWDRVMNGASVRKS